MEMYVGALLLRSEFFCRSINVSHFVVVPLSLLKNDLQYEMPAFKNRNLKYSKSNCET